MNYLFLFPLFFLSQESTNSTGNIISNSVNGSLTYSVGQVIYSTVYKNNIKTNNKNRSLEGVQVPYELDLVNLPTYNLNITPNPSKDLVFLVEQSNNTFVSKEFNFELYSANATLITKGKLYSNSEDSFIDIKNLPTGVYFFKDF